MCNSLMKMQAVKGVEEGYRILILSDRKTTESRVPVSTLLACGAVHHRLIELKLRLKIVLVVETGEAREVKCQTTTRT